MSDILSQVWDFLWQPLLPIEARLWVYFVMLIAFALLPVWVIAHAKYVNRSKR
jgi:hypothetical protein